MAESDVRVDLHCHTNRSDGVYDASAIVTAAAARSVVLLAITDHDTCTQAHADGMTIVRAVELTCSDNGRHVHMLIYDAGGDWSVLETALTAAQAARRARLATMCARLARRGIALDADALLAAAHGRSVGRPDLARAMIAGGFVTSFDEAFRSHLYDGGPVDVPHQTMSPADGVALAMRAGARAALAHPHQLEHRAESLAQALRPLGLTGLEVDYGRYDASRRQRFRELARRLDLTPTAGSDFHADGDPPLGIDVSVSRMTQLRTWLNLPN